jgi:hypothetical protein
MRHAEKTHFASNGERTNGENGKESKVASSYGGVQAPGRRTDEDLRKHGALARELKLQRKLLYTWKYQLEGRPEPRHANLGITAEDRKEKHLLDEITKLKLALADKALENDFFRSALLKIKEGRQRSIASGATASTTPSSRGRKSKAR